MYPTDSPDVFYLIRVGLEREVERGTKFFTVAGREVTDIAEMLSILDADEELVSKMSDNRGALVSFQAEMNKECLMN